MGNVGQAGKGEAAGALPGKTMWRGHFREREQVCRSPQVTRAGTLPPAAGSLLRRKQSRGGEDRSQAGPARRALFLSSQARPRAWNTCRGGWKATQHAHGLIITSGNTGQKKTYKVNLVDDTGPRYLS